jgi:transposase InsO family protein
MWVSFEVEERPDLNALMENFFSTLETELVHRHSWRTRDEAENALFAWGPHSRITASCHCRCRLRGVRC